MKFKLQTDTGNPIIRVFGGESGRCQSYPRHAWRARVFALRYCSTAFSVVRVTILVWIAMMSCSLSWAVSDELDVDPHASHAKSIRDRQTAAKSIHALWKTTTVQYAAWIERQLADPRLTAESRRLFAPDGVASDRRFEVVHELWLKGNKLRFRMSNGGAPVREVQSDSDHTSVFDGSEARTLQDPTADFPHFQGTIQTLASDLTQSVMQPLLWQFRQQSSDFGAFDVAKLQVMAGRLSINDIPCVHLSGHEGRFEMFVSPEQDWSIVRYQTWTPGRRHLSWQIDIEYREPGADSVFAPNLWTEKSYSGEIQDSESASTMVLFEWNPDISDSLFRLDFPPETVVFDNRPDAKHSGSLVLKSRQVRPMTKQERLGEVAADDLFRSRKPSAFSYAWTGLVLTGVMLAWLSWRAVRRR